MIVKVISPRPVESPYRDKSVQLNFHALSRVRLQEIRARTGTLDGWRFDLTESLAGLALEDSGVDSDVAH